jgi:prepilin-type N-terminal cleavage/methylation domain-containing protein
MQIERKIMNWNRNISNEASDESPSLRTDAKSEAGFSLIEVAVAMVVILIALLGVFFTLTYAITYNAGNNSRAQALAVLQEEVERLRALKFTPYFTDADLRGGKDPCVLSNRLMVEPSVCA